MLRRLSKRFWRRRKNGRPPSPRLKKPNSFCSNNNSSNSSNRLAQPGIIVPSEAASVMVKPPGPKGHLLVGVLPEFRKDAAGFLEKMARQYGDVVYIPLGRQHIYCVSHPDAIRDV